MRAHLEQQQPLAVLPGMAHWVFILLLAAILFDPGRYFLFLLVLALIQLALLRARAMAWPYRQIANSDTTTTNYHAARDAQGEMKIVRRDRQSVIFWQIFYRYLVVLGLPITFVALMAARLLRWTRVLEQVGITLEKSLSVILSGFLGDVVTYASDPAQAHRIQSVVETDIKFFLDRPEVSGLHVFAHSLGTPITFETIFQNLADQYRARIHTYVTIGSVLSYFNQVNPVMDPLYLPRFPVRPYPSFNPRFKWMNFWNLADPITEFYGLDEYNLLLQAPDLVAQPGGPPTRVQRDPASPTNIKTRATLQNHSEYWSNLDLVCKPFARRVLGDLRPPEWAPADVPAQPLPWLVGALARLFNLPFHFLYVYSWWAIWLIIFLAPLILLPWLWSQPPVQVFLAQIAQAVSGALLPLGGEAARLFPKQAEAFGEFNTTVLNGLTLLESTATHQLTEALALLVNLLVLALALFNWIVQSIRAPKSAPTLE